MDGWMDGWMDIYIYTYYYIFKVADILVPTTGLASVLPRQSDGDICLCRGLLRIFTKMGVPFAIGIFTIFGPPP